MIRVWRTSKDELPFWGARFCGIALIFLILVLTSRTNAACLVAVTGTIDCVNTTNTTETTNVDGSQSISSNQTQLFDNGSPINATIEANSIVNGSGLRLIEAQQMPLSPITITNDGHVINTLSDNALRLDGNGGLITYSGNGGVTNTASTGAAILADNPAGNVVLNTGTGAISGAQGISASTGGGGTISVTTGSGSIIGTVGQGILASTVSGALNLTIGSGGVRSTGFGEAIGASSVNGNISIMANGQVTGGNGSAISAPPAVFANSNGLGNITIGGSGNIIAPAGRGIWAQEGASGLGGILVTGTGDAIGSGALCPLTNPTKAAQAGETGCSGIHAEINNPADAGNVIVNRSGTITGTSAAIHAQTAGNGFINVTPGNNAYLTGTFEYGIYTLSYGTGSISVSTAGANGAVTAGGVGILAENGASAIPRSADSNITVSTEGSITSTGNPIAAQNIKNPLGVLAGVSAGYFGGTTLTVNPNVYGNVQISNAATVNAAVGDGILAFNFGNGVLSVVNSGSVAAPTGIALAGAPGVQGTIINTGTINGSVAAIDMSAAGGANTINQQAGAINGNVLLSVNGDIVNISGGSISGNIVGNSASNGLNAGTVNVNLPAGGTFSTGGTFDVGYVNVNSGTLILNNDVTVSGMFSNNAILQIKQNGVRTINGNFSQSASGILAIEVSPSGAGQLNVSKTANLAGTLVPLYDPGIYYGQIYTLLTANGISGNFATLGGNVPPGVVQAVAIVGNSVQLDVASGAVAPANDTVAAAVTTVDVENGQMANRLLLDRIGAVLSGDRDGAVVGSSASPPSGMQLAQFGDSNLAAVGEAAAALPQAVQYGSWFRGTGSFASINGSGTAPGFGAESGGFMAGFDRPLMPDMGAGVALGYTQSTVQEHSSSGGGVDTWRAMAYGGGRVSDAVWGAAAGYATDSISTGRSIAGIGTAEQSHRGNEFSFGGRVGLPIAIEGIGGAATLSPSLGLQFLHLSEAGFSETGAGGFDLSNGGRGTTSAQPVVSVLAAQTFLTDGGTQIRPELRLSYAHELANDDRSLTVGSVSGSNFLVQGVKPSRDMLSAGIGLTVHSQSSVYIYADFDTVLRTGNTTVQTVSAGLRIRF